MKESNEIRGMEQGINSFSSLVVIIKYSSTIFRDREGLRYPESTLLPKSQLKFALDCLSVLLGNHRNHS